jgi:type IV secretion system protein TrbL
MNRGSLAAFFANPGSSLALVLAAILTVISYIIITFNFIVTLVESYMTISVGFIFLGFGGSRWTAPYTERYISLAVSIGLKILLLYCLIGAGMNLAAGWSAEAATIDTSPNPMMVCFDIMGGALILMLCCWHIPKLFAAVLDGAISLTAGDALSPVTTMAGLGLMGAGMLAGGTGAAAGGSASTSTSAAASSGSGSSASSAASTGTSRSSAVGPPADTASSPGTGMNNGRAVDPPSSANGHHNSLASLGAEPIGGSGFEAEPPLSTSDGNGAKAQTTGGGDASSPSPTSDATTKRSMGNLVGGLYFMGGRIRRAEMRDQAHHATPPRMPIDHEE